MSRTLKQRMSDAHEADMAEWTGGRVQKGSGNQFHAQGDTKNGEYLTPYPITGDGKSTLGKSISITREMWKKIVEQTFGQTPMLFLRFYRDDRLRDVDLDLAVLDSRVFQDILTDARRWRKVEEEIGDEGVTEIDYVIGLIRDGREHRIERIRELVDLGRKITEGEEADTRRPYFCPTAQEVEESGSGGFDQCCDRPDLHVPLPALPGTDVLSKILGERQRDRMNAGRPHPVEPLEHC